MSASANISFISGPLASTYSLFAVFAFFLTFTSELATPPSLIGSVSPADFPLAQPMGYRRAAAIESVATHSLTAARRVNNAEVCPFVICTPLQHTKVGARTCTTRALYNTSEVPWGTVFPCLPPDGAPHGVLRARAFAHRGMDDANAKASSGMLVRAAGICRAAANLQGRARVEHANAS